MRLFCNFGVAGCGCTRVYTVQDGAMLKDFKAEGGSTLSSHVGGTWHRQKEPQVLL